jgi:hypothetical protein
VLHPELFTEIINAYAKVYPNLQKHASGWHSPEYLHSIVAAGQPGYGFGDVGEGKSSPGSELIIKAVTKGDPRPLWIVINAGSNTLAQALWDYQASHNQSEVDAFVAKLRVFENGAQDNCGAWICNRFPNIHWLRSNYQTYCYGGPSHEGAINHTGERQAIGPHTWEPYAYSFTGQHQWALEHIKGNHGPVGKVWPVRQFGDGHLSFLEGGGTVPWLGLVNKGLSVSIIPIGGAGADASPGIRSRTTCPNTSACVTTKKRWAISVCTRKMAITGLIRRTAMNTMAFLLRSGAGVVRSSTTSNVAWTGV